MAAVAAKRFGNLKGVTIIVRYIKYKTGRGSFNGCMYGHAAPLLERDGLVRKADESNKKFVARHIDHMLGFAKQVPSNKRKATKKQLPESPAALVTHRIDPTSQEFLACFEWRRVRMEALKKHGPRCMCCGATPATGAVMNVDHIKPRKHFPHLALDINNLQILCEQCNHGKGNWDQTDWRNTSAK